MGSLVGTLEDLGLGDILQIVSLSRKSGLLNLTWGEVRGKIFFHDGQVVAAVSSEFKESLGALLVSGGKVPAAKRDAVDAAVAACADHKAVKKMLADDFKLDERAVEELLRNHIEGVVFHFFTWPEGTFSFELQDIDEDLAQLSTLDRAFVLDMGLSPQFLAMEGTRLQDEHRRARIDAPVGPPLKAPGPTHPDAPAGAPTSEPGFPSTGPGPVPGAEPTESEDDFSSVADAVTFYEQRSGAFSGPPAGSGSEGPSEPPVEVEIPLEDQPAASNLPEGDFSPTQVIPAGMTPEEMIRETTSAEQLVPRLTGPDRPMIRPASTPQRIGDFVPEGPSPQGSDTPDLIVVDDDPFLLKSVAHHLSTHGFRLQSFTEIAPALSRLQTLADMGRRPRAAVADLIMPDSEGESTLGGLEFLEKARGIMPALSVYLMSDYENLPAKARAEGMGARFFFMKPKSSQLDDDFGSPELINFVSVLENGLESESRRPAPAPPPAEASAESGDTINLGEELRREFGEDMSQPAEAETVPTSPGLHMLKAMISELNDPSSSGQITLLILRFAAEMMNRSVIFLVARNQLAGLGQFGIELDGQDAQKHVRKIRIPLNEPSIFREAIQKRLPLKKALKNNKWHQYLVDNLGGMTPKEVFVAPIIAGGKIAAILYGDNVPENNVIGDTESLEIFLAQAGLAMEKALLERRLREMGTSGEGS